MQFKYRKCITIFNVHTLDIIKSTVMVYVLYLRLIYYIHVVCILLSMEGQLSLAILIVFLQSEVLTEIM